LPASVAVLKQVARDLEKDGNERAWRAGRKAGEAQADGEVGVITVIRLEGYPLFMTTIDLEQEPEVGDFLTVAIEREPEQIEVIATAAVPINTRAPCSATTNLGHSAAA
jgi:hypothetical protein